MKTSTPPASGGLSVATQATLLEDMQTAHVFATHPPVLPRSYVLFKGGLERGSTISSQIYFFWGCSCSNCFSFFSMIIFSCCLLNFGNRNAICNRMLQDGAPSGWMALP